MDLEEQTNKTGNLYVRISREKFNYLVVSENKLDFFDYFSTGVNFI